MTAPPASAFCAREPSTKGVTLPQSGSGHIHCSFHSALNPAEKIITDNTTSTPAACREDLTFPLAISTFI
jgi:hypothetical protein